MSVPEGTQIALVRSHTLMVNAGMNPRKVSVDHNTSHAVCESSSGSHRLLGKRGS